MSLLARTPLMVILSMGMNLLAITMWYSGMKVWSFSTFSTGYSKSASCRSINSVVVYFSPSNTAFVLPCDGSSLIVFTFSVFIFISFFEPSSISMVWFMKGSWVTFFTTSSTVGSSLHGIMASIFSMLYNLTHELEKGLFRCYSKTWYF